MTKRLMLMLFQTWSVALYELKMILRTRVYQISFFLALAAAVYSVLYLSPMRLMHAVPSSVPLIVCLAIDLVTVAAGVFIASRFFDSERRENTTPALSTRSFPNAAYMTGKAIGEILSLLVLDAAAIAAGLIADISSPFVGPAEFP